MSLFHALPYSFRNLLRAPLFSSVVIVVLGLGIAANTTIFSLVDQLLVNPFPYRDPDQLVMVWEANPALSGITARRIPAAWTNFDAWRTRNHSFQAMEAFQIFTSFNLTGLKTPEHLTAARATPGFFQMLGVNAVSGRTFLPGDDVPGANPTALVTYAFAKNHFGAADPVGRSLLLDDAPYTIIGVLPKDFHLPAQFEGISEYKPDVWVPLTPPSITDTPRLDKWRRLRVCARLKPGTSLAQATADITAIAESRAKEDPELNRGYGVSVFSLAVENTDPDLRNDLRVFSIAAFLVLLLACASLAGLMLVRTAARNKNIVVMAALGARRWALIAPVLGESFILATAAGILGFLASFAGVRLIAALKPSDIHGPERLAINFHAFIFAAAISALTTLIVGLIPAWIGASGNFSDALKSSSLAATPSRSRAIARSSLLAIQIGVTLALAIAALLLIHSFQLVLEIDPGFEPQGVLTAYLSLPPKRYKSFEGRVRFVQQLHQRVQSLPGVESAAFIDNMPLYAIRYTRIEIEGRPVPQPNAAPSADDANVTPDFFQTMKVPLRRGRLFTDQDAEMHPANVVIINETLAHQLWPGQDPVNSHIRELPISGPPGPWQTVVGVTGDFRQFNPETPARPELLWPAKGFSGMTVLLRTKLADPLALSASLEQAVWSIDHDQPLSDIQTVDQMISDYNSQRKFNTLVLSVFATLSIILVLVSAYGLIASYISARIRDIGIRLALGAQRRQVCLSLLLPALPPILAGISLGLAFTLLAKRLIATVLFHTSPLDPETYILTPVALIAILVLISLTATIRAALIEPARILRDE